MTAPEIDILADLDWNDYHCQCPKHDCGNRATHAVHIHHLHRCNDPDLTPFGNRVGLRCFQCVLMLRVEVGTRLANLPPDIRLECESCGAPIATVDDVVRAVEAL